jgi:hypothetical protein
MALLVLTASVLFSQDSDSNSAKSLPTAQQVIEARSLGLLQVGQDALRSHASERQRLPGRLRRNGGLATPSESGAAISEGKEVRSKPRVSSTTSVRWRSLASPTIGHRERTVLRHVDRALDGIQLQFGVTGRRGRRDRGVFGLQGFRWMADAQARRAYEG